MTSTSSARGEAGKPLEGLESESSGRWLVCTESGARYVVDLDAMTLRRTGGIGTLRRDEEDIVLRSVVSCQVGSRAYWGLAIYPDVVTVRETTPVVLIEQYEKDRTTAGGAPER